MNENPQDQTPATKADLARHEASNKADLARHEASNKADFARHEASNKADFARLESKIDGVRDSLGAKIDDVREDMHRVVIDQAKLHGKMHEMEQRLGDRIDQGTSKVLDVLTSFVSQVQTIDRRQVITSHRVEKLESRVDALDRPSPA